MNMKIVGLCGSLRAGSFNRLALNALISLLPRETHCEEGDFRHFPLYDQDVRDRGIPESVTRLGDQIRAADGVIIATPEYNYSIPGALKNAIDWISRLENQPFAKKRIGMISASMGVMGGVRAQLHLRHVLVFLDGRPMNRPEIMIGAAHQKFDAAGKLTDQPTLAILGQFASAYMDFLAHG
jgi:chromate reductase